VTDKKPPPAEPQAPRLNRASKTRKGKLSGGIIAISSAAIVSIYALGRANTNAGPEQSFVEAPAASDTTVAGVRPSPSVESAAATAVFKDGSYKGSGSSRHGGMEVTVVIKDGKIASANVTSCSTRYSCSDVDPLVGAAVSKQAVPSSRVSGATDSSKAYKQALTNALKLAKA
jgi:uncharacterized protein with FMN-binding domain